MIISRTPFRISFFGGGTDYPGWYRTHGGAVLATTIDKYCYLSCRHLPPFFDYRYRVVWSKVENVQQVEDIEHPVVRCLIRHLDIPHGLEVHHVGDLPARSGMGSSSSFTVGLLHALKAIKGEISSKPWLAQEAIRVEQDLLRETVGSQDQVSAAYGGFNRIAFGRNGGVDVQRMVLPPRRVESLDRHLMLFYTGIVRTASSVASTYVDGIGKKARRLRIMREMVDEAVEILASGQELDAFGSLLDEAWQIKRSLGSSISTDEVDDMYRRAKDAGAVGGKLTGAGGGGFLLLFVPPDRQPDVSSALSDLVHVPFRFENSGSQVIFYDTEQDFTEAERERRERPVRPFRELVLSPNGADPRGAFPATPPTLPTHPELRSPRAAPDSPARP